MPDNLLEISDLSVSADGVPLIEGLTCRVGEGELVAVVGPSGCGKTTLLRSVAGLQSPCDGTVALRGRTPEEIGWPQYRRRVLLVDQRPVVLDATIRANFERPFGYATAGKGFPEDRAQELMATFALGGMKWDKSARSLSAGEQQRVCLIRALLIEPEVLLLDEPTSALDEVNVASVERLLTDEARQRGLGMLVVTHTPQQAERLCDRTIDLREFERKDGRGKGGG